MSLQLNIALCPVSQGGRRRTSYAEIGDEIVIAEQDRRGQTSSDAADNSCLKSSAVQCSVIAILV
jgi:hypothetical protein